MTQQRIISSIIPELSGLQELARYLAGRFTYFTLDQWILEIHGGKLSMNGVIVTDPSTVLHGGEQLSYDGSSVHEPDIDDAITILYEDDDMIAVNKTGNLPVHPAGRYFNHTLTQIMGDRCGRKVYPVHRLDRETSGVILLAFDGAGANALSLALARGTKEYLALVHGNFSDEERIVDWPLGPDGESEIAKKRRAWPGGTQKAVTRFRKICTVRYFSLVLCIPETGRLHQIRAHLQASGFPVVGDKIYGRDPNAFLEFVQYGFTARLHERLILPRSALHAFRLVFPHPKTGQDIQIRAPLPRMFTDFIRLLKGSCRMNGRG